MKKDSSAKVGRETIHQLIISELSLYESTIENYLSLIDFAAIRQMAIKSMYFVNKRIHFEILYLIKLIASLASSVNNLKSKQMRHLTVANPKPKVHQKTLGLKDKNKKMKQTIQAVAINTIISNTKKVRCSMKSAIK